MDRINQLVKITSGLPKPGDSKIILECGVGKEEMLKRMNEMIVMMHESTGRTPKVMDNIYLSTSDGCFSIKNATDPDKEIELVPTDNFILESMITPKSILNVLKENPNFNGRRSKGDRVRDRQNWRAKWQK